MKKFTVRMLFVLSVLLVSANLYAARKIVIAVPVFKADGIAATNARTLTNTFLSELERSGRIETKGDQDIKRILTQMQEAQALGDCTADAACARRLGKKLQVGYIMHSTVSTYGEMFVVSVRTIAILGDHHIPTIQKRVFKRSELFKSVRKIAQQISMRFPLTGRITAVAGDEVVVNLGSVNNLKKGDEFHVIKELEIKDRRGRVQFRKKKNVGRLELTTVQVRSSMAEVARGAGFKEGDRIELDQDEMLKRLEREEEKESREIQKEIRRRDKVEAMDGFEYDSWYITMLASAPLIMPYGFQLSISNSYDREFWFFPAGMHIGFDFTYHIVGGGSIAQGYDYRDINNTEYLLMHVIFSKLTLGWNFMSSGGGIGAQPYFGIGFWTAELSESYDGFSSPSFPRNGERVSNALFSFGIKFPIRIFSPYLVIAIEYNLHIDYSQLVWGVGFSF